MKHKLKINPKENNLVFGDCKDWLHHIPDNSVDLIYIDPPFFSNKNYEVVWGNGFEKRSFEDRFKGINHYSAWIKERLFIAKEKLKNSGSIFLHCDYRANYKLREILNEVFGEKGFINEIIWCYHGPGSPKMKQFNRKHDTIFWYYKKSKWVFNREDIRVPYKDPKQTLRKSMSSTGKFTALEAEKQRKKGKVPEDWWVMRIVARSKKENIGYKTQKPEMLIKRIIKCSTNKNDIVLDFFAGGGTTAKVAHDLGRRFIVGDVSPVAYRVIIDRLKEAGSSFKKINPPLTRAEWLKIDDKEFEKKICMFQGWTHNPTSKPVDGWTDKTKRIPVEIKNHSRQIEVGDIRKLAGAMAMDGQKQAVFVAWHFSKGCFEYVAQLEKKENKKIDLVFAHTIIGELVLTPKQRAEYQELYKDYEARIKAGKQKVRTIEKINRDEIAQEKEIREEREQSKKQRKHIKKNKRNINQDS